MKYFTLFSFLLSLTILLCFFHNRIEGFTGKKTNRGNRGSFGHGNFSHRAPTPRQNYHQWQRGSNTNIYDGVPYYFGGKRPNSSPMIHNFYPSVMYSGNCRRGCGTTGNGTIGCLNPSNLQDSCVFAKDCYGC